MNKHEIKSLINKKHPLVLDIGCYDGKDSKELSDILDCTVHCFEPDPLSQEVFIALHGDDPAINRLILYRSAVSNVQGEIDFYQSNHPQSNSIHAPKLHNSIFPEVEFDELIKVKSTTLDFWYELYWAAWILNRQKPIIDFIWADVNGSEAELIEGGKQALANTRYLYIEVANKELYAGQRTWHHIKDMLPDFEVVKAYNWGDNFGNMLFKNTKL